MRGNNGYAQYLGSNETLPCYLDINSPYYGLKQIYLKNNGFYSQRSENETAFEDLFDKMIETKIRRILIGTVKKLKCVENMLPNLSKQKSIASLLKHGTTLELEEMDRICQKLPENIDSNELESKENINNNNNNNNANDCEWYQIYRTPSKMWIVFKNMQQLNRLWCINLNDLQRKVGDSGRTAKLLLESEHTLQFVWHRKSRVFGLEQYWHQNIAMQNVDSE